MHGATTFGLLRRTALMTIVLALGLWTAAAFWCKPADSVSLLQQELITTSAECRHSIERCAKPVAGVFSAVIEGEAAFVGGIEQLFGKGREVVGEVAEDWPLSIDEAAGAMENGLKSVNSAFVARVQTVNILLLLFVLRLCAIKALLPAVGIFAFAALVDACCMRRIAALTFCTPVPSINFWLVQASGVLAAGALGIAAMPFEWAAHVAFGCLALFVISVAGWLRTFHKFGG